MMRRQKKTSGHAVQEPVRGNVRRALLLTVYRGKKEPRALQARSLLTERCFLSKRTGYIVLWSIKPTCQSSSSHSHWRFQAYLFHRYGNTLSSPEELKYLQLN